MQVTKDRLLHVLSGHIGRGNGIGVAALAMQIGVPTRQVRTFVTELRTDGVAVCGTPSHGYYIASTSAELEDTCQFLRRRALHSLTLESRLRKVPLADLLGQLHLRT
jgi:DNA-binding GntR family transcriptional regulator